MAYEFVRKKDKSIHNPTSEVDSLKKAKGQPKPLTCEEIDLLLATLPSPEKEFYAVKIWTGMRTGEMIALLWENVDLENRILVVEKAFHEDDENDDDVKTKGSIRSVELLDPAYKILETLKESKANNQKLVFLNPTTGGNWRYDSIGSSWHKALESLGLEARKPYQTRHTNATMLLNAGLPLSYIQRQFEHMGYSVLEQRYLKWMFSKSDVKQWLLSKTQDGHNGPMFESFFLKNQ